MSKKIYFVQVGFAFDKSVYLPYAAGTIIAYCEKYLPDDSDYVFEDIIFSREKLSEALAKIKDPFMVAFSCSVWNMEYNKALAKSVKKNYPDCIINFGGHSAGGEQDLLRELPFVDVINYGEGEETTLLLLNNLEKGKIEETPNIAYRKDGRTVRTQTKVCTDISEYPSPYLAGTFDRIIAENRGTDFLAVLETNRGCPYSCAYCDWCAGKKTRMFPIEKVYGEIEWLAENKIEYVFCADSNFGMFSRDENIAEKLIDCKKKYGYPQVFRPCYEKNSDERVFKICHALNSVNMDKGATMAYQTLSNEALKNIGRKNLTMEHFSKLLQKYIAAGIPTYSELILGLPGETKDSFCRGICRLLENGQHNSVSVYHCEVLPNSKLAEKAFIREHGIETIKVAFNHIHSAPQENEEVREYSYIVRSTATMPGEDWVYSNLFSVCLQTFHALGTLRFLAIYLHNSGIKTYFDFYSELLDFILDSQGELGGIFRTFREKYAHSLDGDWNFFDEDFGRVTWFFEEGAFLKIMQSPEKMIDEITPYLFSLDADKNLIEEILEYNKLMLRKPQAEKTVKEFSHNLHSYFRRSLLGEKVTLEEKREIITVTPQSSYDSFADYAKNVVWFGRRRGATTYYENEITAE